MTPKEKAEELFQKYLRGVYFIKCPNDIKETLNKIYERPEITFVEMEEYSNTKPIAKFYASITVNEILSMGIMSDSGDWRMAKSYWEEVKQEIEKL
jgi:hypothetical protein